MSIKLQGPARDRMLWCLGNATGRCNAALVNLREAREMVLCADPKSCDSIDIAILSVVEVRDRMLEIVEEEERDDASEDT